HTSSLFISAGGGITSLCMTGIKLISQMGHSDINAGFKLKGYFQIVGANIILYLLMITLTILLGWIGYMLSKKTVMKRWILSPVYEWYNVTKDNEDRIRFNYHALQQDQLHWCKLKKVVNSKSGFNKLKKNIFKQTEVEAIPAVIEQLQSKSIKPISTNNNLSRNLIVNKNLEQHKTPQQLRMRTLREEIDGNKMKTCPFIVGVLLRRNNQKQSIVFSVEPQALMAINSTTEVTTSSKPLKRTQYKANDKWKIIVKQKQNITRGIKPKRRLRLQNNKSTINDFEPKVYSRLVKEVIRRSHPYIKWSLSPLLSTPAVIRDVLKQFKNPSQIEKAIRYIQLEEIAVNARVRSFTLVLLTNAMKRQQFQLSAELNITTALYMQKFKPNQIQITNLLLRASLMFPGWSNRWLIFRMMRKFDEEEMLKLELGGTKTDALNIAFQHDICLRSMCIQLQLASKQIDLAKGHLLQTIHLIMRSNVDVGRASFNFEKAACKTLKAQRMFFSLLDQHPNNPTILRHIAELVKDMYGDILASESMFTEADRIEEKALAMSQRLTKKINQNKQRAHSSNNSNNNKMNQDDLINSSTDFLASQVRKKMKGQGAITEVFLQLYKGGFIRNMKSDFSYIMVHFEAAIESTIQGNRALIIAEKMGQSAELTIYHMYYVLLCDREVC
ncbi:MAG: hypothetical protein EZS28_032514, partial [Streblomastix strix]